MMYAEEDLNGMRHAFRRLEGLTHDVEGPEADRAVISKVLNEVILLAAVNRMLEREARHG